jgi:hypothetical protein
MKNAVFRDVALRGFIINRRFGGVSRSVNCQVKNLKEGPSRNPRQEYFCPLGIDEFMLRKKLLGISLLETSNKKISRYAGANNMIYDQALPF